MTASIADIGDTQLVVHQSVFVVEIPFLNQTINALMMKNKIGFLKKKLVRLQQRVKVRSWSSLRPAATFAFASYGKRLLTKNVVRNLTSGC